MKVKYKIIHPSVTLDLSFKICDVVVIAVRHVGEGGQGGAGAPPAFQVGEQGEQSALVKCNDLFSNC